MDPIQVNMDMIDPNGKATGDVAQQVRSGGLNINKSRPFYDPNTGVSYITVFQGGDPTDAQNYDSVPITANATLEREEWLKLDQTVQQVARERLRAVNHLQQNNLTYNLSNPMGSTVLEWHDIDGEINTEMSMDGKTRSQNARPNYETNYLPLPILHADYEIPQRLLDVSRTSGNGLDTTLARRAARALAESMEDMLITNTTYAFGGGVIYSYLNHPDRVQTSFGDNGKWDNADKTPDDIINDAIKLKQLSIGQNHFGPWTLYIPTNYETLLDKDYDTSGTSTQTIRQRLLSIDGINDIQVLDRLPADNVLLVEMSTEVVEWVNGLNMQNIEWASEGGWVHHYKVIAIQLPRIKSDQRGQSGIVHMAA